MKRDAGFSLLELLLACSLGLLIFGSTLSALFSEQRLGIQMGRLWRQRQLLLRANQLIALDIERGIAVAPGLVSACHLGGRQLWLQILGADGSITTYSVGDPPSSIWRGQVLMRCGSAYGQNGQINAASQPQNRVVLDGLVEPSLSWTGCSLPRAEATSDFSACWEPVSGLVQWTLQLSSNGVTSAKHGQALLKG